MCASTTAANRRSSRARSPGATARHDSNAARGPLDRRVGLLARASAGTVVDDQSSVAGLTTSSRVDPHSRSKPRNSSQSVTAASNAASSTRALLA